MSARRLLPWLLCFSHHVTGAGSLRNTEALLEPISSTRLVNGSLVQSSAFVLGKFQALVKSVQSVLQGDAGECGSEQSSPTLDFPVLDYRNCWGNMVDFADRPVCGPQVMEEFVQSVTDAPPGSVGQSDGGKSGDPVITTFKHFIVKLVDMETVETLKRVAPAVSAAITERERQNPDSCWSSGLAPICTMLMEDNKHYWQIMRKVTLDGAKRDKVPVEDFKVDYMDLKGPFFAEGYNDGWAKHALNVSNHPHLARLKYGEEEVASQSKFWRHKDIGFRKAFPGGLALQNPVASRSAQITFVQDAQFLALSGLTDYSMFLSFFVPSSSHQYCQGKNSPRFPVTVRATAPNNRHFDVAMGVIDWVESKVNDHWLKKLFSTMKPPDAYSRIFSRMWGFYFKVFSTPTNVCKPMCEFFRPGRAVTKVMAIEHMAWSASRTLFGLGGKSFHMMAPQVTSDSKLKVYAGEKGTVATVPNPEGILEVTWDSLPGTVLPAHYSQVASVVPGAWM